MHAFIVCAGNADSRLQAAEKILKSRGVGENPIDCYRLATLTIAGVRTLPCFAGLQSNKPRGVIIEEAQNLTLPAQHAMLKTLEEPGGENRKQKTENSLSSIIYHPLTIILTSDSELSLLPTIRSRCKIIRLTNEPQKDSVNSVSYSTVILQRLAEITDKSPTNRLICLYDWLTEFTGKNLSPHQGSIPRSEALKFLETIISLIHSGKAGSRSAGQSLQAALLAHRRLKNNVNVQLALQQFGLEIH